MLATADDLGLQPWLRNNGSNNNIFVFANTNMPISPGKRELFDVLTLNFAVFNALRTATFPQIELEGRIFVCK